MAQLEPDLPTGYAAALASLKDQVCSAQHRAQRVVNTAMLELYWGIGRTIMDRQATEPWGSKVLDRLAHDLRPTTSARSFPTRTAGTSTFAEAWPGSDGTLQTASAQIIGSRDIVLLGQARRPIDPGVVRRAPLLENGRRNTDTGSLGHSCATPRLYPYRSSG